MFEMLAVKKVINGIPLSHLALGLSVMSLIFVLPALFDPKKFREAMVEFFSGSNALIRTAAFIHLFIAFLILNTKWSIKLNTGKNTLLSIMSIFGYLILARSIIWLWFPDFVKNKARKFLSKESSVYIVAFLGLLFTFGLGYLGIWVY